MPSCVAGQAVALSSSGLHTHAEGGLYSKKVTEYYNQQNLPRQHYTNLCVHSRFHSNVRTGVKVCLAMPWSYADHQAAHFAAVQGVAGVFIEGGVPQITTNEIREMEERWDALAMTSDTPAVMQDITEVSISSILSFISLTIESALIWRCQCSESWHIEPRKCLTFQIQIRGLLSTLGICCMQSST